ncbi:CinA family protein [Pikeienuella piscinae]|uniref:CinA family protein n=1 Tax=Pikeienuella piscinae TaxID=2748098 RepID=A0A7L5BXY7_9RHOB|nr:CinA family protein [Pikeienuella piscinae]QIE54469.1 CinA family protein [Pikeienuella piscinae]
MEFETEACAVLTALKAKGRMAATVESCTGGLVAAALTAIPGSSDVVDRGFVTYSNAAKSELVGVPPELIKAHGAVSPEVAAAMAAGGLARSRADIVVSITGIAGPGGSESKPEGLVCFHAVSRDGASEARRIEYGAIGRHEVRAASVREALSLIIQINKCS